LQQGGISDEEFRRALDEFFSQSDPHRLAHELRFDELRTALDRPNGYKIGIAGLVSDQSSSEYANRLSPWRRRFGLLRHLHVKCDILILRRDAQIPPHGHNRVVSGFYLLGGEVACRHYDRIREANGGLIVRQVLNAVHQPGGFTTNSEFFHNIHWLRGIAPASYLFRVTAAHTPTPVFSKVTSTRERIYVDPTSEPNMDGLIQAHFVTEDVAMTLKMSDVQSAALVQT
jgi:hypothetical protein